MCVCVLFFIRISRDPNLQEAISEARRHSAAELAGRPLQMHRTMLKQNDVYFFTEIENRPHSFNSAPRPPLQEVYPKALQNIVTDVPVDEVVQAKFAAPFNAATAPIPASLPSIHDANTAAQSVRLTAQLPTPGSRPVIRASYANHMHETTDAQEKIIVKVVKAPGWYLNDAGERSSYYNAVAHGLLGTNGLVYVNNVQRVSDPTRPFEYAAADIFPPPSSASSGGPTPVEFTPEMEVPSNEIGSPVDSTFWEPCDMLSHFLKKRNGNGAAKRSGRVGQLVDARNSQAKAQTRQPRPLPPPPQLATLQLESSPGPVPFDGKRTSYDVGPESVGRLASDNSPVQYNLGLFLSSITAPR